MLVNHLSNVEWLAKDFIWLVVSSSLNCSQSSILGTWLDRYQNGVGPSGLTRAGVLQQGLVLSSEDGVLSGQSTMDINLIGHNGLLPKLDMYHLLQANAWALSRVSIIGPASDPTAPITSLSSYLLRIQHMSGVIIQSTSGKAKGLHSEFKRFMVDVATLHLTLAPSLSSGQGSDTTLKLAEYLELVFRSLNQLSERMHHSFFLYLPTGPSTFVTVEYYIIPVVLLILIPAIQVAVLAVQLNSPILNDGSERMEKWISSICCVLLASAVSLTFRLLFSPLDLLSSLLPSGSIINHLASLIPVATTQIFRLLILPSNDRRSKRRLELKVKVAAFSLTVTALSALACINPWLSFIISAFVVAPIAFIGSSESISALWHLAALTMTAPPVISYFLQLASVASMGYGRAIPHAQLLLYGLCIPLWGLTLKRTWS